MIKINNECVFRCLLHCVEQTESKYGEALAHSDGLTKHTELVMWTISEMKKIFIFRDLRGLECSIVLLHTASFNHTDLFQPHRRLQGCL